MPIIPPRKFRPLVRLNREYQDVLIEEVCRPIPDRVRPVNRRQYWSERTSAKLMSLPSRRELSEQLLQIGVLSVGNGKVPFFVLPNDRPLYEAFKTEDRALASKLRSEAYMNMPDLVVACELRCTPVLAWFLRRALTVAGRAHQVGLIPSGQPEALSDGLVESTPWPEGWSVEECACSIGVLPRAFAAELRRLAG
jgi:hypothetical protein